MGKMTDTHMANQTTSLADDNPQARRVTPAGAAAQATQATGADATALAGQATGAGRPAQATPGGAATQPNPGELEGGALNETAFAGGVMAAAGDALGGNNVAFTGFQAAAPAAAAANQQADVTGNYSTVDLVEQAGQNER